MSSTNRALLIELGIAKLPKLKRPKHWQLIRALFPAQRVVKVADADWPLLLKMPLFAKLHGGVDPRPGRGARERLVRLFGAFFDSAMTAAAGATIAPDAEGAPESDEPPADWRGLTLEAKQGWMKQRQASERGRRARRQQLADDGEHRLVCRVVLEFEARRQLRAFGYSERLGREGRRLLEEYLDEVLAAGNGEAKEG
jgi:hypothetical protein